MTDIATIPTHRNRMRPYERDGQQHIDTFTTGQKFSGDIVSQVVKWSGGKLSLELIAEFRRLRDSGELCAECFKQIPPGKRGRKCNECRENVSG